MIQVDKASAVSFLQQNNSVFGSIATTSATHIPHDQTDIWPFYIIPKLDSWASANERVIILGDAAHVIPSSAGQGINQAFVDVYMLALLSGLSQENKRIERATAMKFWQEYRQSRINGVMELNKQIDARRLPVGDESGRELRDKKFELDWLYNVDFEAVVKTWIDEQEVK